VRQRGSDRLLFSKLVSNLLVARKVTEPNNIKEAHCVMQILTPVRGRGYTPLFCDTMKVCCQAWIRQFFLPQLPMQKSGFSAALGASDQIGTMAGADAGFS